MKRLTASSILLILALFISACGRRDFTKQPEVKAEIDARQAEGWEFVEMVGDAHSKPEQDGRWITNPDDSGLLTVSAMNTGIDGYGSRPQEWTRTFKQVGFDFLAVHFMTSPADVYVLVFRKPHSSNKASQASGTRGEQIGTGLPATCPVDEPKDGDKPQPNAEGRSR